MTKNFQAGIVVGVCALLLVSAVAIGQEAATDSAATVDEAVAVAQDSATTASKKAPNLAGTYSCVGDATEGGEYTGYVKITAHGDAYKVQWTVSDISFEGIGIVVGQTLSVGWVTESGQQGVAVYKVPKGKQPLVGRWSGLGSEGKVRNETLTKIKPGDEKQAVSRPTNFWSFFEADPKSH